MTDETRRPAGVSQQKTAPVATPLGEPATNAEAKRPRNRRSVAGGRIAVAGIGIAAMVGLVANMEVANGRTTSATSTKSTGLASQPTAKSVRHGFPAAPGKVAAAKVKRPIVLTPHAVVHTVSAPSSSGGSGYYAAPAAAAPVASSGGSH